MNIPDTSTQSDRAGIASAVLCMVHCLAVPFFLIVSRSYSDTQVHLPSWYEQLDYLFLAVSFLAVYHSAGHTRYREIKVALWFFWACLTLSIVFSSWLHWLAYVASAGLIIAHFVNIRRIRRVNVTPIERVATAELQ